MFDLFDVPWKAVELLQVREFFEDVGEEGVTWEAKGEDERGRLRPDSIRKAACGMANQIGGYLFLGASQDAEDGWTLTGIEIPDPEPELWIGKILRRLQPPPRFDTKAWKLEDGRTVCVVQIEPVAEPPCMTPGGRVYERVSGETLPVEDPALLDKLFRRGELARERSRASALRAANRALEAPAWWPQRSIGIAVASTPIGRETDDIASRLFTQPTRNAIVAAMWSLLERLRPTGRPDEIETRQEQDAFACLGHFAEREHFAVDNDLLCLYRSTWLVQAGWDGSVTGALTLSDGDVSKAPPIEMMLDAAWKSIVPLISRLGGYGPAHLSVLIKTTKTTQGLVLGQVAYPPGRPPARDTLYSKLGESTLMDRLVDSGTVDPTIVESLARELKRAAGVIEDEPESRPSSEEI